MAMKTFPKTTNVYAMLAGVLCFSILLVILFPTLDEGNANHPLVFETANLAVYDAVPDLYEGGNGSKTIWKTTTLRTDSSFPLQSSDLFFALSPASLILRC